MESKLLVFSPVYPAEVDSYWEMSNFETTVSLVAVWDVLALLGHSGRST